MKDCIYENNGKRMNKFEKLINDSNVSDKEKKGGELRNYEKKKYTSYFMPSIYWSN